MAYPAISKNGVFSVFKDGIFSDFKNGVFRGFLELARWNERIER
jgi:hypothetical protein